MEALDTSSLISGGDNNTNEWSNEETKILLGLIHEKSIKKYHEPQTWHRLSEVAVYFI